VTRGATPKYSSVMPLDNPDPTVDTAVLTEGDDGQEHATPGDLLELYEVLEWQAATGGTT